ncbi:MAG: hypothetical protein ACI93R_003853 [Flavobacteriales bacterium]|jgi:hypothetical protein
MNSVFEFEQDIRMKIIKIEYLFTRFLMAYNVAVTGQLGGVAIFVNGAKRNATQKLLAKLAVPVHSFVKYGYCD